MPKNRIHTMNDGRYSYNVTDATGRRYSLRSRKEESLREFRIRCDSLDKRATGAITTLTLDDLFQRWEHEYLRVYNSEGDIRTVVPAYNQHVRPWLGHRLLTDIKRSDVYTVLARMQSNGYSATMIRRARGCISRPFNWAINSLGLDLMNPTQGLRFKYQESPKQIRVLTDEELDRFMTAAAGSKHLKYFRILALTGLRPSEALGLQAKDIKKEYLEIRRGITRDGQSDLKTKAARREIPLTDELRQILIEQRAETVFTTPEGWLFPTLTGTPSMDAVTCAFKRILKQTTVWERGGQNKIKKLQVVIKPIQFSLYDFRHNFASRMAARGMSHIALRTIMGHTDISTTMKYYVGVTDQVIEEARDLMAR